MSPFLFMRITRRILSLLIMIIPLLAITVLSGRMLYRFWRSTESKMGLILQAEATRALGRQVAIGKVTFAGGHVFIEDVRIAEGKQFEDRGELIRAHQVVLDFDIRRILFSEDKKLPVFGVIDVIDPVARIRRDRAGNWNFGDIFVSKPQKPGRPTVGTVNIRNGDLTYVDDLMPHHVKRPADRFTEHVKQIDGHIHLDSDRSTTWEVTAKGDKDHVRIVKALGTYEPPLKRLFLRVQADDLSLTGLNRFITPQQSIEAGIGNGHFTLLRSVSKDRKVSAWYDTVVRINGGVYRLPQMTDSIRDIEGTTRVSNQRVEYSASATVAGTAVKSDGIVTDFKNPAIEANVSGKQVPLTRVIKLLRFEKRAEIAKQVEAVGDVDGQLHGSLLDPTFELNSNAFVHGFLKNGISSALSSSLKIHGEGSFSDPMITASGVLPAVVYHEWQLKKVRLNAVYRTGNLALDFNSPAYGGDLEAKTILKLAGDKSSYSMAVRSHHLQLADLPAKVKQEVLDWAQKGSKSSVKNRSAVASSLSGDISADVNMSGHFDDSIPDLDTQIFVNDFVLGEYQIAKIQGRMHLADGVVSVQPVSIEDTKGRAVITGTYDLDDKTVDLNVNADNISMIELPLEIQSANGSKKLEGAVYLRDGHITGVISDPQIYGKVAGFGLGTPDLHFDYAALTIKGNRDRVEVSDGSAYRFPSTLSLAGLIGNPLGRSPMLDLSGQLKDVSIGEVAHLLGSDADVQGIAKSDIRITGYLPNLSVALPNISIDAARVADFDLKNLLISVRYESQPANGTLFVDSISALRYADSAVTENPSRITGNGYITKDLRFEGKTAISTIDLSEFEPSVSEYVFLEGKVDVSAKISGQMVDGKVQGLSGEVQATTNGLTLNKVVIGDLHGLSVNTPAIFSIQNNQATSDGFGFGSKILASSIATGEPAVEYEFNSRRLNLHGNIAGLQFEELRLALANSPYVIGNPTGTASEWLKPITDPLDGVVNANFETSGLIDSLFTHLNWTSRNARVQGNVIEQFDGDVTFDRNTNVIALKNAILRSGEASFSAIGSVVDQKSVTASFDTNNLSLELLGRWFPGRAYLRDVSGVAESLHIEAEGDIANPTLTASASVKDLVWIETELPRPERRANRIAADTPPNTVSASTTLATTVATTAATTPRITNPLIAGAAQKQTVKRLDSSGVSFDSVVTGRELWLSNAETSRVKIQLQDGKAVVKAGDIRITMREPDPLQLDFTRPREHVVNPRQFQIYASGDITLDPESSADTGGAEMNAVVRVPKQKLTDLIAVIPNKNGLTVSEEDAKGTVSANVTVTGTLLQPSINGEALVDADLIRLPDRATQLRAINVALDFAGDRVRVRNATAFTEILDSKSRKLVRTKEPIRVTGELSFENDPSTIHFWPPRLRTEETSLRIQAKQLQFAEKDLPSLVGARFITNDTSADIVITGSLTHPHIAGSIDIMQADVRLPDSFGNGTPGVTAVIQPSFDVRFNLGDKVRIVASPVTATIHTVPGQPVMLQGDLAGGDVRRLKINGSLAIDSGVLAFPTSRFTIQRGGTVTLRYPFSAVATLTDPTLGVIVNLTAITRITASPSGDPKSQKRYTITVEANGPLNSSGPVQFADSGQFSNNLIGERNLKLTFRSDPPDFAFGTADLQRRVTGILGGESAIQGLFNSHPDLGRVVRQQASEIVSASLFPEFLDQLGLSSALGFEELTVDVSQFSEFTLRATRQIKGPLYAGYWRRFGANGISSTAADAAWEFKLSYRFRPQLQFSFTSNDQRTNAYLIEGVFRY